VTAAVDVDHSSPVKPLVFGWTFSRWRIVATLLAAIIQTLSLWSVWSWSYRNGDAIYYQGQATLNARGYWFMDFADYLRGLGEGKAIFNPTASHPPLTSVVFTVCDWLHLTSFRSHSVVFAIIFVGAVYLVIKVMKDLVGEGVGIVAGLLVACNPYLVANTGSGLPETLVMALVIVLMWCVVQLWRSRKLRYGFAAGVVVSLCAQTRAELMLLLVVVMIPSLVLLGRGGRYERLRCGVAVLAAFLALSAPWVIRNQVTFTNSVLFSDEFGTTLADSNCRATYYGDQLGYWYLPCWTQVPVPSTGDESVIDAVREKAGLDYIKHHKFRAVQVVIIRELMAWNFYDPAREVRYGLKIGRTELQSTLGLIVSYPLYLLAIVGGWKKRKEAKTLLFPVAFIVTGSAAVAVTFASQRYLVEAQLGVSLLAAIGLVELTRSAAKKKSRKMVTRP
jgi:4-amino-4-deoxy-L-arabinose transferase-like glycosyltransferase